MTFARYCRPVAVLFALGFSGMTLAAEAGWHLGDGWVRAVPPNARTTAAYLDIYNTGDAAIEIRAARTDIAGKTEIHDMLHENGLMKMVQIPSLTVPANGKVTLAPGGKHIMMLGLKSVPQEGTQLDVCLSDAKGLEQCASLPVLRDAPAAGQHQHHDHQQHMSH